MSANSNREADHVDSVEYCGAPKVGRRTVQRAMRRFRLRNEIIDGLSVIADRWATMPPTVLARIVQAGVADILNHIKQHHLLHCDHEVKPDYAFDSVSFFWDAGVEGGEDDVAVLGRFDPRARAMYDLLMETRTDLNLMADRIRSVPGTSWIDARELLLRLSQIVFDAYRWDSSNEPLRRFDSPLIEPSSPTGGGL